MNLLELQALLGHASLETIKRYIELLDEDLAYDHKEHWAIEKSLGLSTTKFQTMSYWVNTHKFLEILNRFIEF